MNMRPKLKAVGVLLGLLLLASACGDSSETSTGSDDTAVVITDTSSAPADDDDDDDDDGSSGSSGAGGSGSDFCVTALELANVNPFGDITGFDGSAFASIDGFLGQAAESAPSDIRDDVLALRDAFNDFGTLLAEYDFNFFDADLQTELTALNVEDLSDAGERVASYMRDECGIDLDVADVADNSGSLTDPNTASSLAETFTDLEGNDAAVQALILAFGVDEELAECLREELGDFDTSRPDPSLLTQEACGTTLLEVVTNIGSGG